MKKIIILMLVFFSYPVFGQVNVKDARITKVNPKALDPGIGPSPEVYPIISGKVSATPISIPSPENTPIQLEKIAQRTVFSNMSSKINDCYLVHYLDNVLNVKMLYALGSDIKADMPVYAGAWFYDKESNAVDVGYTPQEITERPSGSVIIRMGFNKYPVTTEYIKLMIIQDGKVIADKSFKAGFLWKGPNPAILKPNDAAIAVNTDDLKTYVPDLEITAIKVIDKDQNTSPYESNCRLKDKLVFVTNKGNRESSPYILSVGYIEDDGGSEYYKEVKRFQLPPLLPGTQTLREVRMPDKADNIRAEIIYSNSTNGEINTDNNHMEKKCSGVR